MLKKIWTWAKIAFAIIFSVLVYVFFTRRDNGKLKEKINEVKAEAKVEEEKVKKIEKRIENRKEEAKDLADRLKKHFRVFIIVCLLASVSIVGITIPTIENLIIPDTYSELLIAYKDIAEIAIGYQKLYTEAEADNQALMEVVKNLQSLMKVQQDIIDDLLQKNRFSLLTGISLVPLHPTYSGIMAGITFEF